MAEPLARSVSMLHPAYHAFRPGMCAPEWRWFWQLAVFADPLWGVGDQTGGAWDYASWVGPSMVEAHSYGVGPRGWRRLWDSAVGQDYAYGTTGGAALGTRSQWNQNGDISMFAVIQPVTRGTGDLLVTWEGGGGETAAENSTLFVDWNNSDDIEYIHESGSGTNTNIVAEGILPGSKHFSLAITRNTTSKSVRFYKNGLDVDGGTYTTNPSTSTLYIAIGDRPNSDTTFPSDQYIECMYLFKAVLTPAMIVQLTRDPWGPFRGGYRASSGTVLPPSTSRSFIAGMIG